MSFTGKATYSAGAALPEIAEDVADIIGIVSPYETPLLDHLGDPQRSATSTVHEWLEDSLLPTPTSSTTRPSRPAPPPTRSSQWTTAIVSRRRSDPVRRLARSHAGHRDQHAHADRGARLRGHDARGPGG